MSSPCLYRWISLFLPLLVSGCASHADRLHEVCNHFYAGQLDTTVTTLDNYTKKYSREAECFKPDRAIVDLVSGRPQDAEKLLREVRDSLDNNQQASLAESAGSMFTDDTVTAYAGEDYERVLIRDFLAICSLTHGGDDARAYALQTTDLQEEISPIGRHGMLTPREATVHIAGGRNTYLLADFVDDQLLGKIVTSDRP